MTTPVVAKAEDAVTCDETVPSRVVSHSSTPQPAEEVPATRVPAARALGLTHKGHLGAGADGDITMYDAGLSDDPEAMFASPRFVVKGGQVLVEDGHLRTSTPGKKIRADLSDNAHGESLLEQWFEDHGSYSVKQFGMHVHERNRMVTVAKPQGAPTRTSEL